jgi:hypothetical protein
MFVNGSERGVSDSAGTDLTHILRFLEISIGRLKDGADC